MSIDMTESIQQRVEKLRVRDQRHLYPLNVLKCWLTCILFVVTQDLVRAEKNYVQNLDLVVMNYMMPIRAGGVKNMKNGTQVRFVVIAYRCARGSMVNGHVCSTAIFSNLDILAIIHKELLVQLEVIERYSCNFKWQYPVLYPPSRSLFIIREKERKNGQEMERWNQGGGAFRSE